MPPRKNNTAGASGSNTGINRPAKRRAAPNPDPISSNAGEPESEDVSRAGSKNTGQERKEHPCEKKAKGETADKKPTPVSDDDEIEPSSEEAPPPPPRQRRSSGSRKSKRKPRDSTGKTGSDVEQTAKRARVDVDSQDAEERRMADFRAKPPRDEIAISSETDEHELDVDELVSRWEGSLVNLRSRVLAVSSDDKEVAQDLRAAHIGDAYIQFVGPGAVESVLDLDTNPNVRANPRGLSADHVGKLFDIISRPNGKKDHEAPILICVARDRIAPDLQDRMSSARAEDLLSEVPLLQLKDVTEEERQLEVAIWTEREDGKWLDSAGLVDRQARLKVLRQERTRATLLNGNHRTRAMLRVARKHLTARSELRAKIERGIGNQSDLVKAQTALNKEAESHTWRVKVYDTEALSPKARNYLVHNEHERPAKSAGVGERVWWLGQKFEAEIAVEQRPTVDGETMSRADAANIVHGRWLLELDRTPNTKDDDDDDDDNPGRKAKSKQLGDAAGNDNSSRLFYNPVTMEMALQCRHALSPFEWSLDKKCAIFMLKPGGAALVAYFWISMRTLLNVFDVARGGGLTDAETWLESNLDLNEEGYHGAIEHYNALHCHTERVPTLLEMYTQTRASRFAQLWEKAVAPFRAAGYLNFRDPELVLAVRKVFDEFGKYMNGTEDNRRMVAASCRLYARLPRYQYGCKTSMFYPTATLPSNRVLVFHLDRWRFGRQLPDRGDCLALLETLLERGQLVWTIGATGNTQACNWNNWYARTRGLHQVVHRLFQHDALGSTEARLTEALLLLEDPRLLLSLQSVHNTLKSNGSLQHAIEQFSARKSAKFDYPGVDQITHLGEYEHGSPEEITKSFLQARVALRSCIVSLKSEYNTDRPLPPGTESSSLREILSEHPILELVDDEHWPQAFPNWYLGWRDANAKIMGSIGMGLGWGLLERWFNKILLPRLLKDQPARWALSAAHRVLTLTETESWWADEHRLTNLPAIPRPLPPILSIHSASALRQLRNKSTKTSENAPSGDANKSPRKKKTASQKTGSEKTGSEKTGSQKAASQKADPKPKAGGSKASKFKSNPRIDDSDTAAADAEGLSEPNRPEKGEPEEDELVLQDIGTEPAVGPMPDEQPKPVDETSKSNAPTAPHNKQDTPDTTVSTGSSRWLETDWREFDKLAPNRLRLQGQREQKIPPPPSGFAHYHSSIPNPPPPHVLATPIGSTHLVHHAWSRLGVVRDKLDPHDQVAQQMDAALSAALDVDGSAMSIMLKHISRARYRFRKDLVQMVATTSGLSMPRAAIELMLPELAGALKDAFLVTCAAIFGEHLPLSHDEAMHEAAIMLAEDGLFRAEIVYVEKNWVWVNLLSSFPKGMQREVRKRTNISIAELEDISPAERSDFLRYSRFVAGSRSLGQTEAESRERAMLGVEHQSMRHEYMSRAPNALVGLEVDLEAPETLQPVEERDRNGVSLLKWRRSQWWHGLPSLVRENNPASPFSTGDFVSPGKNDGGLAGSRSGKKIIERMSHRATEYEDSWRKAGLYELKHFNTAKAAWKEGDDAPDIETDDDSEVGELAPPPSQDVGRQSTEDESGLLGSAPQASTQDDVGMRMSDLDEAAPTQSSPSLGGTQPFGKVLVAATQSSVGPKAPFTQIPRSTPVQNEDLETAADGGRSFSPYPSDSGDDIPAAKQGRLAASSGTKSKGKQRA
ncbi:hypothetical protein FRC08_001638 [Ceratobasidium sp. 394]|nr:hypothetical protein FRC08_001638 [Ceratobasidium sp. 394]